MSGLVVDLLLQGEVLRTVPFDRPDLRIGRMRENDIVVDGPDASRFHARLQLDAGRVFLEDGGSENGTVVNERRVRGRRELAPGDRILIGRHELRVRSRRIDEQASVDAPTAPPEALREEPVVEAAADVAGPTDDEARDAEPGDAIDGSDLDGLDVSPTELFGPDEGREALAPARLDDDAAGAEQAASPPTPQPAGQFAGLIVQRDGKIDRVVPWEGDSFTVGRSAESDLVLPEDEVSRKHARFARSGDRYEVHDLGSVNGTLVNGSRVDVHVLGVGDVITIEGFELTFVLDREPIAGAMKPSCDAPPRSAAPEIPMASDDPAMAFADPPEAFADPSEAFADPDWEVDALPPAESKPLSRTASAAVATDASGRPISGDATIANVMLEEDPLGEADGSPAVATLDVEEAGADFAACDDAEGIEVEDGLDDLPFEATIDPRKELAAAQPRGSSRAASVQDLGLAPAPARIVTLELRLRLDQLSEPLRSALEEAGISDLVIPADLRLRTH